MNDKGEIVPMIEGSGAWLTLNLIKGDKPISLRCNGMPKLKEAIRDNYSDILKMITEEDYTALEEEEDYGEI